MGKRIENALDGIIEPFKRTPEGKLLVGELELLRLLADAEARRTALDSREKSVTEAKRTNRKP